MRKLARVGRPASRSDSSARTSGSRRSTCPRSAAARRTRPSSRCTWPDCQPSLVATAVSEETASSRASSQCSSGRVPVSRSVASRSRSTYSVSRPTRSTCALPTSSSGRARSSQAGGVVGERDAGEQPVEAELPGVLRRSRRARSARGARRRRPTARPDSRAQRVELVEVVVAEPEPPAHRLGPRPGRGPASPVARPPARSSSAVGDAEQRVGLPRRTVGEPDPQPMRGMAAAPDHVAEPEPGLDQRRVRLDVGAHHQDVTRLEGGVVVEEAEQHLAQHVDLTGDAVAARAPGPTGRRWRSTRPSGRGRSAARSPWSRPSRVSGGGGSAARRRSRWPPSTARAGARACHARG